MAGVIWRWATLFISDVCSRVGTQRVQPQPGSTCSFRNVFYKRHLQPPECVDATLGRHLSVSFHFCCVARFREEVHFFSDAFEERIVSSPRASALQWTIINQVCLNVPVYPTGNVAGKIDRWWTTGKTFWNGKTESSMENVQTALNKLFQIGELMVCMCVLCSRYTFHP